MPTIARIASSAAGLALLAVPVAGIAQAASPATPTVPPSALASHTETVPTTVTFDDVADLEAKAASLSKAADKLSAATKPVSDAHEVYLAEQAQAEALTRQQAEQAVAAAQSQGSSVSELTSQGYSYSPSTGEWYLDVGGYCGEGGNCAQAAVDGNDVARIDYPGYGFSEIAGHNYGSAGQIAGYSVGDVVHAGGATYRITGIQYLPKGSNVPHAGFAFQTCVGDQLMLAWAEQIG
jgi:hypothetical protein